MSGSANTPHRAAPPDPHTGTPDFAVPPGSVDAHLHLFGPQAQFPHISAPPYLTDDALPESAIAMHEALGVDYGVVVSGGAYGRNTDYLVDVLERFPGHFRGVAVLPVDQTDAELARLDRVGVRGIRFVGDSAGNHVAHIEPDAAARVHELGWHVQFVAQPGELETHAERLLSLPNTLVIDHFGGVDATLGTRQAGFETLLRMLDTGRVWVKISGPMYPSRLEYPFADVRPLAEALVSHAPERLVWGSDWPHLHMGTRRMPNDAELIDQLADWVPTPSTRNAILADNAQKLYGFPHAK